MQPDGKDFKWEMLYLYLERFYFEGFLDRLSDEGPIHILVWLWRKQLQQAAQKREKIKRKKKQLQVCK